jgi:putative ABC transport system substrate-binding protein
MAREQVAYPLSRRSFCWTLAGVLVAPRIAIAQTSKVRRIGFLEAGTNDDPDALQMQAKLLRERGWVEGQNLLIERRYGNGRSEALQGLAEELVRAQVEIILTNGTPATLAAKRATTTIPIVFSSGDPVLLGLVASLAHPGGNLTGYSSASPEVSTKRLSLLKELLPRLQRLGALWQAGDQYYQATRGEFEHVCQSLGLVPIIVEVGSAAEINSAIEKLVRQRAQALFMPNSAIVVDHGPEILSAAMKHRLPTMAEGWDDALILYGPTWQEAERRGVEYIDRILRGAKPGDLPVQQPTKFVLTINLKTAKALGLTIPNELLLRADEVIQ